MYSLGKWKVASYKKKIKVFIFYFLFYFLFFFWCGLGVVESLYYYLHIANRH